MGSVLERTRPLNSDPPSLPPRRQGPLDPQRLADAVRILTMAEPAQRRGAVSAPWVQRERILFAADGRTAEVEALARRRLCDLVIIDAADPAAVRIEFAILIDALALHLWFTNYRLWRSLADQSVHFVPHDASRLARTTIRDGRISGPCTRPLVRDEDERQEGLRLADAALRRLTRGR